MASRLITEEESFFRENADTGGFFYCFCFALLCFALLGFLPSAFMIVRTNLLSVFHFSLGQEPDAIMIGRRQPDPSLPPESVFGYSIPLLHSLVWQLRSPSILHHVAHPNFSQDRILRDTCDRANSRNHPLVAAWPDCLRIKIYYDEAELTDPLSFHTSTVSPFLFAWEFCCKKVTYPSLIQDSFIVCCKSFPKNSS